VTSAAAVCRSCGTEPRNGARFCEACGVALSAAADPAKYKQVTVLFADVVRSMDIAAVLDIERSREIMTELVERSATAVQHYGGTVEYNGDGVMALFGAPVALEDHAFRACLAALAIQDEADRVAAEVTHRDGVALQVRVGLNSGRVIAGEFGSGSLGYRATGEQVGMAQRIESAAPPGGVMLSEDALQIAERSGDDMALAFDRLILGLALAHRHTDAERDRGQKLLEEVGDVLERRGHNLSELRLIKVYMARERARHGDRDGAISLMFAAVDQLVREGQLLSWGIPATGVLVATLLERGTESDVVEAEAAIERLAAAPADDIVAARDTWMLRLRALLARARGDAAAYGHFRDRYCEMAESLGFEGHIDFAKAMIEAK
jgi:class 3 adenylate cyclase